MIEPTVPELKLPRRRRQVRRAVRWASGTTYTLSAEARRAVSAHEEVLGRVGKAHSKVK